MKSKLDYLIASYKDGRYLARKWVRANWLLTLGIIGGLLLIILLLLLNRPTEKIIFDSPTFKPQTAPLEHLETPAVVEAAYAHRIAAKAPSVATPPPANCVPDNPFASHIYLKESGCNPDRWNGSGCYGLGQACPASKIAHCGADFTCQHAWFSNYADERYGGWEQAYNFWLANHWW